MTTDERIAVLEERIAELESKLPKTSAIRPRDLLAPNERVISDRVNQLSLELGLVGRPQFFVGAVPLSIVELTGFFESSSKTVRLFENPLCVRSEGFGMYPAEGGSTIVGGQARQIKLNSQIRRIARDGQFVALFRGDDDFLGWAMKSTGWPMSVEQQATPYRINSLVLIEAAYGCVRLARDLIALAQPQPVDMQYIIGLNNMKWTGQGPKLLDGKADRNLHHYRQVQADLDECLLSIVAAPDQTSERITFRLVAELYHQFGLSDDRVPYSEIGNDGRQIVPSQF